MNDMSELNEKMVCFPAPIYIRNSRRKNELTDLVVVSLSKRNDGLIYVVQNANTGEVMSIQERFWPSDWSLNASDVKEQKPRLKKK